VVNESKLTFYPNYGGGVEKIIDYITEAIVKAENISIKYHGGSQPGSKRE